MKINGPLLGSAIMLALIIALTLASAAQSNIKPITKKVCLSIEEQKGIELSCRVYKPNILGPWISYPPGSSCDCPEGYIEFNPEISPPATPRNVSPG